MVDARSMTSTSDAGRARTRLCGVGENAECPWPARPRVARCELNAHHKGRQGWWLGCGKQPHRRALAKAVCCGWRWWCMRRFGGFAWLALVVLFLGHCGLAAGLSASELKSSVPVRGTLDRTVRNSQHIYFINVSSSAGRAPSSPVPSAPQRLSVKLTQEKPAGGGPAEPLVLSLCRDQLPCGDLGCSCPRKFVDDGTRGGTYSAELARTPNLVRSVDVSPCELESGTWYVSVDVSTNRWGRGMTASQKAGVGYTLTAVLESASISFGEATDDEVCCKQAQYFVLDISKLVKGNELSVKLISDDRLHNQSPLKLSLSYDGCVDERVDMVSDAQMGQVVTLSPEQVHKGRLFVGVHSIDRDAARFLLSVSYRPELKWTVIAFLVSVLIIVVVTITVVCCVRVRRRMRKMKAFSDEVKLRKKNLKMSVRGPGSEDGSCAGSAKPGRVELSDRCVRCRAIQLGLLVMV